MFKKFTVVVESELRRKLREQPGLKNPKKSPGFKRVNELMAEIALYAAMLKEYQPPSWLGTERAHSSCVFYLMSPNFEHTLSKQAFEAFSTAQRIECVLGAAFEEMTGPCFSVKLSWFEKDQHDPRARHFIYVDVAHAAIYNYGGEWPDAHPLLTKFENRMRQLKEDVVELVCYHNGCTNRLIGAIATWRQHSIVNTFNGAERIRWNRNTTVARAYWLKEPVTCPKCRARFAKAIVISDGVAQLRMMGYEDDPA